MSDRSTLFRLLLDDPADDTARLVLADLLRESDDSEEQARGRFLWAGVVAARFRREDLIDDPIYYTAQREIEAVAAAGHLVRWLAELGVGRWAGERPWGWDCVHDRVTLRLGLAAATFARGMLAELELSLADWYETATSVLESSPLESVSIVDVKGLSFSLDRPDSGWRLTARLKLRPRRIALGGGPIPTVVAPSPVLVETDRWGEATFSSREELCQRVAQESKELLQSLETDGGR